MLFAKAEVNVLFCVVRTICHIKSHKTTFCSLQFDLIYFSLTLNRLMSLIREINNSGDEILCSPLPRARMSGYCVKYVTSVCLSPDFGLPVTLIYTMRSTNILAFIFFESRNFRIPNCDLELHPLIPDDPVGLSVFYRYVLVITSTLFL